MRLAVSEEPPPQAKGVMLRIPFVRRCALVFDDGTQASAFLVNINALGVYVAHDEMPKLGQGVRLQFSLPDSERELALDGAVVWLNPRQQHPVHSLPPGFGVKFGNIPAEDMASIERVMREYTARQPGGG
jgi:Tfp pilus assembly protein PilZ